MPSINDIRLQFPDSTAGKTDLDIAADFAKFNNVPLERAAFDLGVSMPNAPGFTSTLKRSAAQMTGGLGEIYGDVSGDHNNALATWSRGVEQSNPSGINSFQDIADNPGLALAEATANGLTFLVPAKGLQLAGQGLKAAKYLNAARAVDNPVTQAAVAGLPSLAGIGEDQRASGQGENLWAKYGGAGVVGAIENLGGIQRLAGINRATPGIQETVNSFGKTPWRTVGKTVGRSMLEEGAEELAQNPLERWAGYKDPTTPQNMYETALGGAMGALGGLGFGAYHGGRSGMQHSAIRRDIATDLLNTDQSFGRQQNLAQWESAFRNKAGEDGQQWYGDFMNTQNDARLANTTTWNEPLADYQQRVAEAGNPFMGEGPTADFVNSQLGIGQKPVQQHYASAYNQRLPEPVIVPDSNGNPITISTVGEAYDYQHGMGKFAPQEAKVDALGYPISPYQPVIATPTQNTTPSWHQFAVAPTVAPLPPLPAAPPPLPMVNIDGVLTPVLQGVPNAPQPGQVAPQAPQANAPQAATQQTAAQAGQVTPAAPAARVDQFNAKYEVKRKDSRIGKFLTELDTALNEQQITPEEHADFEQKLAEAWKLKDTKKSKNAVAAHNALAKAYTDLVTARAKPANVHKVAEKGAVSDEQKFVDNLLNSLSMRERRVLELYHFDKQTMEDIGETLSNEEDRKNAYTRSRIQQIHNDAVGKIKQAAAQLGVPAERIDAYFGSENNSLQGGADVETRSAAEVAQSGATMHTPGEVNRQVQETEEPSELSGTLDNVTDEENFDKDNTNDDVAGANERGEALSEDDGLGDIDLAGQKDINGNPIRQVDVEDALSEWSDLEDAPLHSSLVLQWTKLWIAHEEGVINDARYTEQYLSFAKESENLQRRAQENQGSKEQPRGESAVGTESSVREGNGSPEVQQPVADEAAGRSDSEGQAGEVDGKLYRRETLVFTDSTGQHFSEEVESIDIRNTEDLLNALDDVAYNQLSGTLDYVSGFHATDSLDAYAYPNGDGTYKIVLPRALLSGHPETLTRVLHHELGHVADAADAINGGKNSSGIAMGVMVQKAKALYDKLPANSKLKKHLEYPFHSKYPESGSAKMQRTELYAQLVSAYLDPELSAELRAVHPTLFNFAESIVNEIEEQYQEDAESSDAGVSPSRVVHQGNHAVVRQRGAAAQQDPAYGKAKTLVKQLLETVGDYFQSTENALLFGHNLAEKAKSLIPGANKYFESVRNKQVERVRQEEQIAAIAEAHYALSEAEQAKVNKFLDESTSQEKWGYQPEWVKTNVVDAAMAQRFNALSPEAQKVVKGVFKFGAEQQERFDKAVNDNLDPKDRVTRRQMYAKPYAPLKRFGDHVVVGKSAAYIKEKARLQAEGKTTSKSLEDLQANPNHYYVEFVDSDFEAIRRRDALAAANPNLTWDKKPLQKEDRLLNATSFSMLKKLQNQIGGMDANKKTKAALESLANQLYVAQLNRLHANKSQMSRKGVKGYDQDMMRAFVSQGRAEAALIANLKTHAEAEGALQLLSNAAREGSNQDRKTRMANAVMTRHLALLNYKSTPIQDLLLKINSVYFLLTSPAYYLTNATQPFVISLPYMSAKFGGAKSWGALVDSYKIAFGMTKLFKDNKLDASHLKKFDSVGRESDALQTLIDENLVNIGMEMELGDIVNRSKVPGFKQLDATVGKMRSVVGNVEKLNRLSSAAAAYRLAYTEARNAGKDLDAAHEAGTAYARDVLQKTHGDYSGYNAPTLMMQGAYGNLPVKTLLQFKKFQFIQFGLLAGAAKQAFAGSSVEERALGRKVLGYILGTQMALAGMVGIPLLSGVIPAILTAAFGDDGEDKEEFIRRMLGGGNLAQLVTHGVPAAMGLDISKRVGMGNVADPFRFMDGQTKPADWALSLAGPSAGLASRFWQGVDYMRKGEYWKGAEFMVPNGIANASKALRFETTGVTNSRGDVVMKPEEIGFFDDVFQALGLPTTTMTDRQWATGVLSNKDHYFKEQASKIKHDYVEATRSGEGVAEARQAWMELQAARVRQGFERQKMSDLTNAPKEQAKRERNVVDGIQFTKTNQAAAKMISEL